MVEIKNKSRINERRCRTSRYAFPLSRNDKLAFRRVEKVQQNKIGIFHVSDTGTIIVKIRAVVSLLKTIIFWEKFLSSDSYDINTKNTAFSGV